MVRIKRFIHKLKKLPRRLSAINSHRGLPDQIFPDDIFLVSYPRSGNTWVRTIIANYLTEKSSDQYMLSEVFPEIPKDRQLCNFIHRPRFIKSHEPFLQGYPQVIYLVRDCRDVLVSLYHFQLRYQSISTKLGLDAFIYEYLDGKHHKFGDWGEHVRSWTQSRQSGMLLIRYEDLLKETEREITRIIIYAGLTPDPERIVTAVANATFDKMKKNSEQRTLYSTLGERDMRIPFVRVGSEGQWRKELTTETSNKILEKYRNYMTLLGYHQK
ncbi:sulfotransferase domain-containing protein [Desulfococcaceae bacterium HSG7]|nr:sulfotransferase domain-containing protein [Desulfococcaceae bacterium HSG7]